MKLACLFTTLAGVALSACDSPTEATQDKTEAAQPQESPDEFVARVNEELAELGRLSGAAEWVRATYINKDTAVIAADVSERSLAYLTKAVKEASKYDGMEMGADAARQITLLKLGTAMPAPDDPEKRAELARIATELEGMYGAGKYCPEGVEGDDCFDLEEMNVIFAESRDYDELAELWAGWRTVSPAMRDDYRRFVELTNEGARELGYADLGEMWKSKYEMSAAEFEQEAERLWTQVKPLYDQLHCYVRAQLTEEYGENRVPADEPIPAHLLGNMWAQEWGNIYPIVEPYPGVLDLDVTGTLQAQEYDAVRMTRTAENFFVSLGMPELPASFYERSLLTKPRDRDVVCHASAWPLEGGEDVRIKQCVLPNEEHLQTLHHELGHIYYYLAYKPLPELYKSGAHDGFHEGIGDTMTLSMTPAYLAELGLVEEVEKSREAVINQQMKLALDKIAFLPFGKLIDQWRWNVFAGKIAPEDYNAAWWALRTRYQGVAPPVPRSEADFDPGAKYHIPGNTPYTRYFLARILQFQFHRALCEAGGFEGPIHECSIYGNEAAGDRLWTMMKLGASKPWPEALEAATGSGQMDASAIIDYFEPLMGWLEERNQGQACGW
ncbi:MAG TPA: M2 family metallopeptidase [Gammaproteobacteria bacterium]|nr:M2 family metallopeptidase [Gammaproteobacteria bacterium]